MQQQQTFVDSAPDAFVQPVVDQPVTGVPVANDLPSPDAIPAVNNVPSADGLPNGTNMPVNAIPPSVDMPTVMGA